MRLMNEGCCGLEGAGALVPLWFLILLLLIVILVLVLAVS